MRKIPRRNIACPNKKCKLYGRKFKRNIKKNGHKRNGVKCYRCISCGKQFTATFGTPLYQKKLKKKEIKRICELFVEKLSFRAVARATKHNKETIRNLAEDMAEHCRQTTDFFLKDLSLTPIEVDEIWTFVKKNKKELPKNFARSVATAIRIATLQ